MLSILWPETPHGGSGSSQRATSSIGATFLHFLQGMQLATHPTDPSKQLSILDVGCGWGEWLPSMLLKAVEERSLREDFVYFGLDIAEQPIDSLRTRFGHSFQFAATWMKQDEECVSESWG